jgi:hypothetical protein
LNEIDALIFNLPRVTSSDSFSSVTSSSIGVTSVFSSSSSLSKVSTLEAFKPISVSVSSSCFSPSPSNHSK